MLKQKPKPIKRANGKGSVTMRKDANRAKPVMVRATVNGKQVYIGDAETYEDGLLMLADYGTHPERYLKSYKQATFAQIYNLVCGETFKGRELDDTTIANYQSSLSTAAGYGINLYQPYALPIYSKLLPIRATAAAIMTRRKRCVLSCTTSITTPLNSAFWAAMPLITVNMSRLININVSTQKRPLIRGS